MQKQNKRVNALTRHAFTLLSYAMGLCCSLLPWTYSSPLVNLKSWALPKTSGSVLKIMSPALSKKQGWVLGYLKRSFAALTTNSFLTLYKILSGHILNALFKHPLPFYPATQSIRKVAESRHEVHERAPAYPVGRSPPNGLVYSSLSISGSAIF